MINLDFFLPDALDADPLTIQQKKKYLSEMDPNLEPT